MPFANNAHTKCEGRVSYRQQRREVRRNISDDLSGTMMNSFKLTWWCPRLYKLVASREQHYYFLTTVLWVVRFGFRTLQIDCRSGRGRRLQIYANFVSRRHTIADDTHGCEVMIVTHTWLQSNFERLLCESE
jgi:hypothetical protein